MTTANSSNHTEATAYPLAWPENWSRTETPEHSRFRVTLDEARREVVKEIERMGGSLPIISTNLPLRKDGFPYASARAPDDAGVAVYFQLKGQGMVFACDRWRTIAENLHAIACTIDALRGIERWGASDMLKRAFEGFQALPPGPSEKATKEWWEILGFRSVPKDYDRVKTAFRELARKFHPDIGEHPDGAMMTAINVAFDRAENHFAFREGRIPYK